MCTYRKYDIFMKRRLAQCFTWYGSGGKGLWHISFCDISFIQNLDLATKFSNIFGSTQHLLVLFRNEHLFPETSNIVYFLVWRFFYLVDWWGKIFIQFYWKFSLDLPCLQVVSILKKIQFSHHIMSDKTSTKGSYTYYVITLGGWVVKAHLITVIRDRTHITQKS